MVSCNCLCKQCCACVFYEYSSCWLCRRQGVSVFYTCKNASFGQMTSFDFLYMICISFCSFIIVSLLLCCINESTGVKKRGKIPLYLHRWFCNVYMYRGFSESKGACAEWYYFAVMCAIYAVVLPIYALFRLKGGKQGD